MMLFFFLFYAFAVIVPPSNELFDIKTYSLEDFFQEFEMHRVMPGLQHGKLVPRNTGGAIWKVWFGNQTHYILGVPTLSKGNSFFPQMKFHNFLNRGAPF
eukprot:UN22181